MSLVPVAGGGNSPVNVGAILTLDPTSFSRGVGEAVAELVNLDRAFQGSRARMAGWGAGLTAAGFGILKAMSVAARGFGEFEANMRNVQSISASAQINFGRMSQSVIELGRTANRSAVDLSDGLYEIVSSGFDGAAALSILESAAIAASAGLTDTQTSAKGILGVLNAYGLGASDAADISDILFQTVNVGVGTFEELTMSLGEVVGLSAVAGVEFDEVAAAIAAMSLSAIDFQTGAISLNRLIQSMLDPTDQMSDELARMGYESGQAALQQLGLQGVMDNLRVSIGDNAQAWLSLIPDIRGVRAALALISNEGENYARVAGVIQDETGRAGSAARAFEIQQRSLQASVDRLGNGMQRFMFAALVPLVDALRWIVDQANEVIEEFDRLPDAFKTGIVVVVGLGAALMVLLGGALLALPLALTVATRALIRHTAAQMAAGAVTNGYAVAAWNAVMANRVLAATISVTSKALTISKFAMGGLPAVIFAVASAWAFMKSSAKSTAETLIDLSSLTDAELLGKMQELQAVLSTGLKWQSEAAFRGFVDLVDEAATTQPALAVRLLQTAEAAGLNADQMARLEEVYNQSVEATQDAAEAQEQAATIWESAGGTQLQVSEEVADALQDLAERAQDYLRTWNMLDDPYANQERALDTVADRQDEVRRAEERLAELRGREDQDRERHLLDLAQAENDLAQARERAANPQTDAEGNITATAAERESAALRVRQAEMDLNELREETPRYVDDIREAEGELAAARRELTQAEEDAVLTGQELLNNMLARRQAMTNWSDNMAELRALEGIPGALVQEFIDMGPEGAEAVEAFMSMNSAQRQLYVIAWRDAAREAMSAAIGEIESGDPIAVGALRQLYDASGNIQDFLTEASGIADNAAIAEFLRTLDLTQPDVQEAIDGWFSEYEQRTFGLDMELALNFASLAPNEAELFDELVRLANLDNESFTFHLQIMNPEIWERFLDWQSQGAPLIEVPVPEADPGIPGRTVGSAPGRMPPPPSGNSVGAPIGVPANDDPGLAARSIFDRLTAPFSATGGIFNGAQWRVIGEAGPEAVIPLSDPTRAMRLMQQSGLYNMVLSNFRSQAIGNSYDNSVHTRNEYRIDQVVTQDSRQFFRDIESRRRADALMGV